MLPSRNYHFVILTIFALLPITGCGGGPQDTPETGTVSGVVTLDGKPLADVIVTFEPEKGRPSSGKANEEGRYELVYSKEIKGAKIGHHTVRINSPSENPSDKETLPAKFHKDSTLKKEVKAGSNEINIELKK